MVFALPALIQVQEIHKQGVNIYYPKLHRLPKKEVESRINTLITHRVKKLMEAQYQKQGTDHFTEMLGSFEIKTNERNIFSVTFGNYAYREGFAHGLSLMDSITVDLESGRLYSLADLFKPDSDYVKLLSSKIRKQIEARQIPLLDRFPTISKEQSYYIADKSLVLYFQAYDISPGYVGLPAFPLNAFYLEDLLLADGPLDRLLPTL